MICDRFDRVCPQTQFEYLSRMFNGVTTGRSTGRELGITYQAVVLVKLYEGSGIVIFFFDARGPSFMVRTCVPFSPATYFSSDSREGHEGELPIPVLERQGPRARTQRTWRTTSE